MAHQITHEDGLVLTAQPAWHGLGTLVTDAPSPTQALQLAKLDWGVEQWPLTAASGEHRHDVLTHVLNVRADTHRPLGVVGVDYTPVQNRELAEFVAALGQNQEVEIESAGSIRGGRRVWFLARGRSIWVGDSDEVRPYLLVANGHDGSMALTCQPTSIRVVCHNTLHMALNEGQGSRAVRFRHEGDIADKLEEAKASLALLQHTTKEFEQQAAHMNTKEMSREELQRFWLEVHTAAIGAIPSHPSTTDRDGPGRTGQAGAGHMGQQL